MQRRLIRTLVQNKQFDALRDLANEMLATPGLSLNDQAVAHNALCVAFSFKDQHGPAVSAGEIAMFLSKQTGDFDLLGEALYHSGIALGRMRWLDRAIERFEEYAQYLGQYSEAKALYPKVLLNHGIAHRWLRDFGLAADKMAQAWSLLTDKTTPDAQPFRRNYVWLCMLAQKLEVVPHLLTLGRAYLADHPNDHLARYHQLNDEARFAFLSGDYDQAYDLATCVVQDADAYPSLQAESGLTLHYIAIAEELYVEALALAFAVKIKAAKARREDLDAEASRSIAEIDQQHDGRLLRELLVAMGQTRAPLKNKRHQA